MLDDIYILLDYVNIVNDKIINVVMSCIIRRIVTYHYTIQMRAKIPTRALWTVDDARSLARVGRARSLESYGDGPGFLMMKRKKTESGMLWEVDIKTQIPPKVL